MYLIFLLLLLRSPTLVKNMISGLGFGSLNASYQVSACGFSVHQINIQTLYIHPHTLVVIENDGEMNMIYIFF